MPGRSHPDGGVVDHVRIINRRSSAIVIKRVEIEQNLPTRREHLPEVRVVVGDHAELVRIEPHGEATVEVHVRPAAGGEIQGPFRAVVTVIGDGRPSSSEWGGFA
jgi:hypothetical protein